MNEAKYPPGRILQKTQAVSQRMLGRGRKSGRKSEFIFLQERKLRAKQVLFVFI